MSTQMKRMGIMDIAREAGVSKSTVSLVLRNDFNKSLRQETRDKVWAVAEKYGYRSNLYASALRNRRSMTVGIVLNSQSPVSMRRLMELERLLYQRGYAVMIRNGYWNMAVERGIIDNFLASRVEGVIVVNATEWTHTLAAPLHKAEIPVVSMEMLDDGKTHCIVPDRRTGMYNMMNLLLNMHHRHLCYIHAVSVNMGKEAGIEDALAGFPATVDFHMVPFINAGPLPEIIERVVKGILENNPRTTAISCSNDEIAMLAIRTLLSSGVRVPQDISVTGFDDIPAASYFMPSITTVTHPVEAQSHRAVEVLISNIENNVRSATVELVECPVMVRESISACPRYGR